MASVSDEPDKPEQPEDPRDLTDELARKYDPDRLLKIFARRAGRGEPLEHSVRARYERRFGVDLGHVRVVTGEFAQEFNRQRGAYAVTVGSTGMILMGGSPDKSTAGAAGQALLAHELTHVAQQSRHAGGGLHRKAVIEMPFAEEHEAEAEQTEQAVMHEASNGDASQSGLEAHTASVTQKAAEQHRDAIERVKARVLELFGEMTRVHVMRSGVARRP